MEGTKVKIDSCTRAQANLARNVDGMNVIPWPMPPDHLRDETPTQSEE